jgi:hypothetical protein
MGDLSHEAIMRSIELFGTRIIPAIHAEARVETRN